MDNFSRSFGLIIWFTNNFYHLLCLKDIVLLHHLKCYINFDYREQMIIPSAASILVISWANSAGFAIIFNFLPSMVCPSTTYSTPSWYSVEPRVKDGIKFYPRLHLSLRVIFSSRVVGTIVVAVWNWSTESWCNYADVYHLPR